MQQPRNGHRHKEEANEDKGVSQAERGSDMAFSSPSLGGIWAAVAAGLGLTIRTDIGLPASVSAMTPEIAGLPALPKMALFLHRRDAEPEPVAARLGDILLEAARQALPGNARTVGLRAVA